MNFPSRSRRSHEHFQWVSESEMSSNEESSGYQDAALDYKHLHEWTNIEVVKWLGKLDFHKSARILKQKGTSGKDLARVDLKLNDLMRDLGLPVEQSVQIFSALKVLKSDFIQVLGDTESFSSAGLFKFSSEETNNEEQIAQENTHNKRFLKHNVYSNEEIGEMVETCEKNNKS